MSAPTESNSEKGIFVRHFSEVAPRLYAYIFLLVQNHAAADDVFQEVSVTLWESYDDFQPGSSFYAWAREIAHRRVLKYRQLQQRDRRLLSEDVLDALSAIAARSNRSDDRLQALDDCCNQLDPQDRELLDRRYAPKATVESVASELGKSLHQVYRSLRRIHRVLYRCIQSSMSEGGG